MLSIPNYCRRNAHQNDSKKSDPTSQNGQSQKSTNYICGREQGGMGKPPTCSAEGTLATATRTDSLCMAEKKIKRANPWISEKAMATHSSTLAWKVPRMEKPGRLQSMGSLRVGHEWATSLSLFTFMHWRRKWQPTPVFLLGESQGQGSLVGCHPWGHTELDTTEVT